MFDFFKLFGKHYFSFDDDLNGGNGDPGNGQPGTDGGSNGGDDGNDGGTNPTEIEVNGVKIPVAQFDELARSRYKDQFSAYDNREKWQAENTRKAQEYSEYKRRAEAYERLLAQDPRFSQQSQNPVERTKLKALQNLKSRWGNDVNPEFISDLYDQFSEAMGIVADERLNPIRQWIGNNWEKDFLRQHPEVQRESPEYQRMVRMVESGADPEDAFEVSFKEMVLQKRIDEAIKKRDEDARRKLQQSRQTGGKGAKSTEGMSRSDKIWAALEANGYERP